MRRYLFYIHALSGGGAERVWSVLASALAERGHRVTLAVDYDAAANLPHVSPAVRLHVLGGSHGRNILRLARLMRAESPDVAISALAASNLKLTAAAALAGMLARTVISYHGYGESEPQRLSQLGFWAASILSRLTARTVCVSDGLLHHMRRHWGAAPGRSVRLYNPVSVPLSGALLTAADLAARPPIVLAAGRFAPYKNFVGLVQAFAAVSPKDSRLVILGEGAERATVEREIRRLGLEGRVDLRGYVADPSGIFAAARCFVLPSRSESFGLVIVEALAHGLPVVATACDGPIEILTAPGLGTLVPHDDEAALAKSISEALARPGQPEPRRRRAADFSVTATTDDYERLFDDVVARSAPRPSIRGLPKRKLSLSLAMAAIVLVCGLSRHAHAGHTVERAPTPWISP